MPQAAVSQNRTLDSLALVALYNHTQGWSWYNANNWLDVNQPISNWHGISMNNGRVSRIDLPNNNLVGSIPMEMNDLSELDWMSISGNALTTLPSFTGLSNLRVLHCSGNQFQTLPNLQSLTQLDTLNANDNQLANAEGWDGLGNLRWLNLGNNQLILLPDMQSLTNLRWFKCSDNQLIQLPDLSNASNLFEISCSRNQLTSLPSLQNLTGLRFLYIDDNMLTSLPNLSTLTQLEQLAAQRNSLTSLPSIHALSNLQSLDLSYNSLSHLPDLNSLSALRYFNVDFNYLQSIPDWNALTQLEEISISHNELTSLPDFTATFPSLTRLHCSHNFLTSLPSLSNLPTLLELNCNNNQLASIPDILSNSFQWINFSFNRVSVPPYFQNASALQHMYCAENRIPIEHLLFWTNFSLTAFEYAPQANRNIQHSYNSQTLTMWVDTTVSSSVHEWYIGDSLVASGAGMGRYALNSPPSAAYWATMTHPSLPDLTLYTHPIIWQDSAMLCYTCDANEDNRCTLEDLEYMAFHYDSTGTQRECGEEYPNWYTLYKAQDISQGDSDGNGFIDMADTIGTHLFYEPMNLNNFLTTRSGNRLKAVVTDWVTDEDSVVLSTKHGVHFADSIEDVRGVVFVREIIPPAGYRAVTGGHDLNNSVFAKGHDVNEMLNFTRFFPATSPASPTSRFQTPHARIEVALFRTDGASVDLAPNSRVTSCIVMVEEIIGFAPHQRIVPDTALPLIFLTTALAYKHDGQVDTMQLSADTLLFVRRVPELCGRDIFEPNQFAEEAGILPPLGVRKNASLCIGDDEDWFYFTPQADAPHWEIRLFDLPDNYDLEIYTMMTLTNGDSALNLVATSYESALLPERIFLNNAVSGQHYYVRVMSAEGRSSDEGYQLVARSRSTPFVIRDAADSPKAWAHEHTTTHSSPIITNIRLYPNPTSQEKGFVLESDEPILGISLWDIQGKLQFDAAYENLNSLNIDTSRLPKGIYTLGIRMTTGMYYHKCIVQ